MKGALIEIEGNWGHFKKPETNNNPLTHDFITKTAFIGMIGAVLGIERAEMKPLFPQLSEDICYGVQIRSAVKKESWSFKLRYADNLFAKRPVQMEFLKKPCYTVALALHNERSLQSFDQFTGAVQASEAKFTPVLGLHNCPANLRYIASGEFTITDGEFKTKSFITEQHKLVNLNKDFRIGVERVPTFQNDDFWNLPDKYVRVFYPSGDREISASGKHYEFTDGSRWALI